MKKAILTLALLLAAAGGCFAQTDKPLLMRDPTLSSTNIVFAYAGDLWIVGRDGGEAARLTVGAGTEGTPVFSPDGKWIAFTGEYDGNIDVYVVAAGGGVPRRLTFHPAPDNVSSLTPDGKQALFPSPRSAESGRTLRPSTMPVQCVFPIEV